MQLLFSPLFLHGMAGLGELIMFVLLLLSFVGLLAVIFSILHIAQASSGKPTTAVKVLSTITSSMSFVPGALFFLSAQGEVAFLGIGFLFCLPLILTIIAFVLEGKNKNQ